MLSSTRTDLDQLLGQEVVVVLQYGGLVHSSEGVLRERQEVVVEARMVQVVAQPRQQQRRRLRTSCTVRSSPSL